MRSDATASPRSALDCNTIQAALSTDEVAPIRFDQVTKRYGDTVALKEVTLRFEPGECHLLAGPNGSGKSTAGALAVGLTQPSSGTVSGPTTEIGFGFQQPRFYPSLSVTENVTVFARAAGVDPTGPWISSLTQRLRLDEVADRPVQTLSGGFKKKLDLAISMLDAPQYLWLDEPLSDLDTDAVEQVRSVLEEYVDAGGGVVISTHNLQSFGTLATQLTVLVDGVPAETSSVGEGNRPLETAYRDAVTDFTGRRSR